MSKENISLKQAERKVFSISFNDGLVDIFISSVVLMFAVAPFLSRSLGDFWSSAIFLPIWGILFIILRWIRIHVVNPRKGAVEYGSHRKRKLSFFSWLMLGVNIVFFVIGLAVGFVLPINLGLGVMIPFSVMVLAFFSLAGYFLEVSRFYVYGLMIAVGPFIGEWLYQTLNVSHHGYPIIFGIYTAVIFLIGLIKLIKFLRDNPLPTEEQLQWKTNNG
ncbi:MAG: hypothetical protein ACWGN2_05260 [Anaerolineales bacterium]